MAISNPLLVQSVGVAVRGSMSERGLDVEIDIPESDAGRALMQAHEEVGVVVRPFLDTAESVGTVAEREGRRVMEYEQHGSTRVYRERNGQA